MAASSSICPVSSISRTPRHSLRGIELAQLTRGDVILDLEELEFLGSVGLRAFLGIHAGLDADGRRLVLRNPQPAVVRLLEMTQTDALLVVE